MSPSARLSKVSSSCQHHPTFSQLIPPSERTSLSGCTRHVETAAVENLGDFRFRAPVTAERTAEYSLHFCEMTRVKPRTHRCRPWKSSRLCTADTWFERSGCRPMLGGTYWDNLHSRSGACMYECARMYRFFQGLHGGQMLRRRGAWRAFNR